MDAHLAINGMRPSDFRITNVRYKNFRQGYGAPTPENVLNMGRVKDHPVFASEWDHDHDHYQLSIPGTVPDGFDRVRRVVRGSGDLHSPTTPMSEDDTKVLQRLHHTTADAFNDAEEGWSTVDVVPSSPSSPSSVPQPSHEAQFKGYTLTRHPSPSGDVIRAWDEHGNHVGGIQLSNPGWEMPNRAVHSLLYVDPHHQGNGLAGAMSRFAQFTHPTDPIKTLGVSDIRTHDGDRFARFKTDGKADLGVSKSDPRFEALQDQMVDPRNDPKAREHAERRNGKQLRLFE